MTENTLDVITVIKNPGQEIYLTIESLNSIAKLYPNRIRWIIIDGGNIENSDFLDRVNSLVEIIQIEYVREIDGGIYSAMNKGLARVRSDYFIFINSGDKLNKGIFAVLAGPNLKVIACNSSWHAISGDLLPDRTIRKPRHWLGIMPNHQGMVFPQKFKTMEYNSNWKISSDQDLKLHLWAKNELIFSSILVSSCLVDGVSMRKLTLSEVFTRARESSQVFRQHYNFVHATMLCIIYFINYLLRLNWKNIHQKVFKSEKAG